MARDVDVYQTCSWIDEVIDDANTMSDIAGSQKHELEQLAEHMQAYLNACEMPEDIRKYCIGAWDEVFQYAKPLDLTELASSCELNLESIRSMNSDLRSIGEDYGIEADQFEGQVERLETALYNSNQLVDQLQGELAGLREEIDAWDRSWVKVR